MIKLCIFASGAGSNAVNIIKHFSGNVNIEVALVVCNRKSAGVVQHGKELGVDVVIMDNETIAHGSKLVELLQFRGIHWIVLAGFLRKVPSAVIASYPKRIVNIHPALLPKYGGKGMYGRNVHEAVHKAGEKQTGITIHLVTEEYDEGAVVKQITVQILQHDTVEDIEQKVRKLEHELFPRVIEDLILKAKN